MMNKTFKKFLAVSCCAAALFTVTDGYCEERGNPLAGEEFTAENYVQDALDAANKGVEVVFPYVPHQVYQIYLQEGFITDIKLSQNEVLKYVGGGDTTRWKIDTSTTGSMADRVTHIFVKPTQRGISTNLIVNTDKRTYQLLLVSGNHFNPMVSWITPKSDAEIYKEKKIKTYSTINPRKLDFGYKVSNTDLKWSPAMVFSSENKTYLKMKPDIKNTELPAFFILDDENKMTLVSYRFVKGYLVVDRLFDKAVLIQGKKKIKITKK